jgi:hypothetical protein
VSVVIDEAGQPKDGERLLHVAVKVAYRDDAPRSVYAGWLRGLRRRFYWRVGLCIVCTASYDTARRQNPSQLHVDPACLV